MGSGEGSKGASTVYNEPISPAARSMLLPEFEQVIHWVFTFQNPVDVDAVKAVLKSSLINNCPRLRSLAVTERNGRQRWKELPEVDIGNHVIIVPEEEEEDGGKQTGGGGDYEGERENDIYINQYVAALASSPLMSREKPLWEMHVLPRRRCFVLRLHHALGDGMSLLALFLASCERADAPGMSITFSGGGGGEGKRRAEFSLAASVMGVAAGSWKAVKVAWYTLLYTTDIAMQVLRPKEDKTMIDGGVGVEHLARKLATLALCLDDIKAVKNELNATINDVFVGIISYGIAKYLKLKSSNEALKDAVIPGVVVVSTREERSKDLLRSIKQGKKIDWGNRIGAILLPIRLKRKTNDPLDYVRKARAVLNRKKLSLEAHCSYKNNALITALCGLKTAALLSYKIMSNLTLILSNIVGPSDVITFAKNRITKIGVTGSSLPLALMVHMLTYNGKAFLNVLVAGEVIPDPELLCMCFEEALQEMKSKATNGEKIEKKSRCF